MCCLMAAVASLVVTTDAWNLGFLQSHSAPSKANASGLPSSNYTVPKRPSFLQVVSSSDSSSGSQEAEVANDAAVNSMSDSNSGSQEAEVANDAAVNSILHKDVDERTQATDDEHEYEDVDESSHFGEEDVGTESEEVADQDGDEAENDNHDAEEAEDDEDDEEESAAKESRHLFEDHHGEAFASEHDEDSDNEESSDDEEESDDEDDEEVEIADPDSDSDIDEMDGQEDSFVEVDEGHLFEDHHGEAFASEHDEDELDTDDSEAEEAWEHDEENYRLEA